jgi:hypothetical protein
MRIPLGGFPRIAALAMCFFRWGDSRAFQILVAAEAFNTAGRAVQSGG